MEKINKLEEDVKLLRNEVNELKNLDIKRLWNEVNELKNLFLNFARQYEINNKTIFDKLNQMNIEQNRNNSNNSSKSCKYVEEKEKKVP